MAERSSTQPDLLYGAEGQAEYFTPALAEKEREEPQVPPVASKSRFHRLLSASDIQGRRIRRALYVSCLLLLIIIWTVVVITFEDREQKEQWANLNSDLNDKKAQGIFGSFNMVMRGHLRTYESDGNDLTVEWEAILLDDKNNDIGLGGNTSWMANLAVYRDVHTVPITNQTIITEYQKFYQGVPDVNVSELVLAEVFQPPPPPIGYVGRSTADSVVTDITLNQLSNARPWNQPRWGYPFDRAEGSLILVMCFNDTGAALGHQGIDLVPLTGIEITESILGFNIKANSTSTCSTDEGCELAIDFVVARPSVVQFVVIVVVIVNWLVTIGIFLLMCESVALKRAHILKGGDIIGICLTALFALPSVRAILPGAPDFGCLVDLVGILPNVILISLSSTIISIAKIRHRLEHKKSEKIA